VVRSIGTRTTLWLALVATMLAACSKTEHDDPNGGTGSGGATSPLMGTGGAATGTGGAGAGTGGMSAMAGMGSGGSTAAGTGGVGGGTGGSTATGSGGAMAMPSDAGMDAALADAGTDAGPLVDSGAGGRGSDPPFPTVYRIALRVHRGDSDLTDDELSAVLDEMNWIWWSQAAICFEIEVVSDEATMQTGFDFWFHKGDIPCSPGANGVYCGDHDIHTKDTPSLAPVDDPMWDTVHDPSRTSAHELGHGLTLEHYDGHDDSPDSLMSSGRQGFKLHDFEIEAARTRADQKKLDDTGAIHCTPPVL
jgi:hypothetical protein